MWYIIRHMRRRRLQKRLRDGSSTIRKSSSVQDTAWAAALWNRGVPFAAWLTLGATWTQSPGPLVSAIQFTALVSAVLVAVHHAEVVAHRVGEPFGSLILALAVTVIEVTLIVSLMLSGGAAASSLARDTVFATVMIVCNGGIGLCLIVGTLRHFVLAFRVEGTSPPLSVLIALTTLTLILPTWTTTTPGPTFSVSQLTFASVMSLVLYGLFVFVQTVRHRDYFLPEDVSDARQHAPPPSPRTAVISLSLLAFSLTAVVALAESLAPYVQMVLQSASAPAAVTGIVIALLVLLPETWAAIRAAMRNRMQSSFNLLLGSALATIGLTIPCVAMVSLWTGNELQLGLPPKQTALLALTFLISIITLASGRATVLHGAVHLMLFAIFLFLAVVP